MKNTLTPRNPTLPSLSRKGKKRKGLTSSGFSSHEERGGGTDSREERRRGKEGRKERAEVFTKAYRKKKAKTTARGGGSGVTFESGGWEGTQMQWSRGQRYGGSIKRRY